mmetsp:Transcript_27090/g.76228  ORF Transcript_27090/g.76228 Transcript_27090/m.76228 type:complete len:211 (+) Transcript_27090:865-1497(+)
MPDAHLGPSGRHASQHQRGVRLASCRSEQRQHHRFHDRSAQRASNEVHGERDRSRNRCTGGPVHGCVDGGHAMAFQCVFHPSRHLQRHVGVSGRCSRPGVGHRKSNSVADHSVDVAVARNDARFRVSRPESTQHRISRLGDRHLFLAFHAAHLAPCDDSVEQCHARSMDAISARLDRTDANHCEWRVREPPLCVECQQLRLRHIQTVPAR